MKPVDIVLATYNGERFLEQQIESILAQTYREWRLLIHDDGSSDATPSIIERYCNLFPNKICALAKRPALGVVKNFCYLLSHTSAPYVFLCDQDDLWLPNKVEILLERMLRSEEIHGKTTAILLHSDLELIDAEAKSLHSSFWRYAHLRPEKKSLKLERLIAQNIVTGCASLCNRALLQLALPIPAEVVMHDWWLALIASALGVIESEKRVTTLYRQHGNNLLGAGRNSLWQQVKRYLFGHLHSNSAKAKQALLLETRLGEFLSKEQRELLKSYQKLHQERFLRRLAAIYRYRFAKQGFLRQLAFLLKFTH